jgi:hypothetical protein
MPLPVWLIIIVVVAIIARRLLLEGVGRRALAKVPETAKLVPTESPNWQNRSLIDAQTSPLKFRGFEDVGSGGEHAGRAAQDSLPSDYERGGARV